MDFTAIATTPMPQVTGGTGTGSSTGSGQSEGISFADMMQALNNAQANAGTAAPTTTSQSQSTTGLGWREMQALQSQLVSPTVAYDGLDANTTVEDLLAQLLAGLKTLPEDAEYATEDAELLNLVAKLQQALRKNQQENGALMLGEEWMLMMAQFTGQDLMPVATEDGTMQLQLAGGDNSMLTTLLTGDSGSVLTLLANAMAEQQAAIPVPADAQQAEVPAPQAAAPAETPMTDPAQAQQAPATQEAGTAYKLTADGVMVEAEVQQAPADNAQAQVGFSQAVQEAKANLAGQAGTEAEAEANAPKADADTQAQPLDNPVAATRQTFSVQVPDAPAEEAPPAPVSTQLAERLQQAVAKGEEEFTLKLRPEGLGEMEVRLSKTADGIMLNILTRNDEAQKMLAAEIDMLRDSLKPLRVEVENIQTFQQEAWQSEQEAFTDRHDAWQQAENARQTTRLTYADGDGETEQDTAPAKTIHSALDTYI